MWRGGALVALVALPVTGCVRPGPPTRDSTAPTIVLTALNAVGRPTFASDEPGEPLDACAKFRSFPARFVLSVGDAGGVAEAELRTFQGRILQGSVSVGPDAPESSWDITRPDPDHDVLTIRLRPPRPGTVRTGLLAVLDVEPTPTRTPPFVINASGRDVSGNAQHLYAVDARVATDGVTCR